MKEEDQALVVCWQCAGVGDLYGGCSLCGGSGDLTDHFIGIYTRLLDDPDSREFPLSDMRAVSAAVRVCTGEIAVIRPKSGNRFEVLL